MASRYWVGSGSANTWAATGPTNWSATSGGSNNASVPGATDDVFFDANSPAGTGSVIGASISIQSLDCTGYTHDITQNNSVTLTVTGSGGTFKLVSTMTWTLGGFSSACLTNFTGTSGTMTVDLAGLVLGDVNFNGAGGGWQFTGTFGGTAGGGSKLTITRGTVDFNNQDVLISSFVSTANNTRVITLGSGTISLQGTGTIWNLAGTGLTFDGSTGNGTIKCINTTNSAITLTLGSKTYGNIWFSRGGSTGQINIGGSNTFTDIKDDGTGTHTLSFAASSTTTVSTFHVNGTSGHLITIRPAATGWTLSCNAGIISCDFLSVILSTATGGATFYAGANSTNDGSSPGWIFTAPPAPAAKSYRRIPQAPKRASFY